MKGFEWPECSQPVDLASFLGACVLDLACNGDLAVSYTLLVDPKMLGLVGQEPKMTREEADKFFAEWESYIKTAEGRADVLLGYGVMALRKENEP